MKWFFKCLRQYADFRGRARRKEFWLFQLWCALFSIIIMGISYLLGGGVPDIGYSEALPPELMPRNIGMGMFFSGLITLYSLAMIVPAIAVTVRRLHDVGLSGWWYLVYLLVGMGSTVISMIFGLSEMPATPTQSTTPIIICGVISLLLVGVFLYFMVKKGDKGHNRYGDDPKESYF